MRYGAQVSDNANIWDQVSLEKKIEFTLVDVLSMQNINNCLKCMLEAPDKVGLKNDLIFFYFSKNIHVGCDP